MVHEWEIEGLAVRTGDVVCTTDGSDEDIRGQVWRFVGRLLPGEVDHVAVYVGPGGRCVEAGARLKVIAFDLAGTSWDAARMVRTRGPLIDVLHGIAYPLERAPSRPPGNVDRAREEVAEYCLLQADLGKPFNLNFLDSATEDAFYCSQLVYRAYLRVGVNLNTGIGIPHIPGTESIVFPQEIWSGCVHRRP